MTFAKFFLDNCNRELQKNIKGFSVEVKNIFLKYDWPGNLREMNNVIKRAALLCNTDTIIPTMISREIMFRTSPLLPEKKDATSNEKLQKPALKSAALRAEYEKIVEVLKEVNYNKSTAALVLNIDRKTIYNKMRAFQIAKQ